MYPICMWVICAILQAHLPRSTWSLLHATSCCLFDFKQLTQGATYFWGYPCLEVLTSEPYFPQRSKAQPKKCCRERIGLSELCSTVPKPQGMSYPDVGLLCFLASLLEAQTTGLSVFRSAKSDYCVVQFGKIQPRNTKQQPKDLVTSIPSEDP